MQVRIRRLVGLLVLALLALPAAALAQGPCADRLPTERITLNLRDANVQTTLRLLAQQYRVNMVVTDEVKGTITLDFYQVPARDIFQVVIDAANLQCVEVGGVLRCRASPASARRTRSGVTRPRSAGGERRRRPRSRWRPTATGTTRKVKARGAVKEKSIRLSYANAEEVAKTILGILGLPPEGALPPAAPIPGAYLPPPPINIPSTPPPPPTSPFASTALVSLPAEALAKGLTVRAYKPTNSVFIRYYEHDLERIEKLIKEQLDIPLPQVQIAATMVITTQNALEQLGVQWGGAAIGKTAEAGDPRWWAPASPPRAPPGPRKPAW